jgi:Aerotolerance regulator N-terminal/von Willebrand factor type A domain
LNLSFLNPFFLIGLSAALLPILIHLISKKRGIRKSFSAVHFLLASEGKVARESRIKDLILLFLRFLILVLLVLVFSRPAVFSFSPVDARDVKSVAIVVDNSFSMGYRDNFKNAKNRAEKLIESLPDGSFGAIVPLVPTESTRSEITQDRRKMAEDLKNLKLSYTFTDNERRLEEILNFIESAPNKKKELIFFTDFEKRLGER